MKKSLRLMILALGLSSFTMAASAATECTESVDRIWAGDAGQIWFHLSSGGSFKLLPSDPNQKSILSMGLTAMTTNYSIVVRYATDNVVCANAFGREDVKGIYLYSRKL